MWVFCFLHPHKFYVNKRKDYLIDLML
ncbi:hypothetical protein LV92_01772 [Arenibacter echinorum]|uniref:Uncharacterized protein n=1 Tax=Arenibacter echinorum TaxID=440515 RepID=A0A327RFD8_9FLAO|nr:hypothetical protein LV92_01772 [Arenibacter echinorum]